MKIEWRKPRNKAVVISLSALLLVGHIPFNVIAQESDGTVGEVIQEPDIEGSESIEVTEPRQFGKISEFIHNFDQLTNVEIDSHINTFKLFSDDASVLHSVNEEVNEEINQMDQKYFTGLVKYLETVRENNLVELEKNPDLINKDLIDENVDVDAGIKDIQTLSAQSSVMATSSAQTIKRLQGADRYETAISISQAGWTQAETVVIVDAGGFADALSGAPLAKALNAPILLAGNSRGNAKTIKEMERLGAKKAIILGGELAVSKTVETDFRSKNITVERIAGDNRYATAKLISDKVIQKTGAKKAILVSGVSFADAMSVAPFASREGMPIYLTKTTTLVSEVKEASKQIKNWTIVGGDSAVSQTVENELKSNSDSFQRIEGIDRYETNRHIIEHFGVTATQAYVATGLEHMDALAGSVLAAKQGTGVILVRNNEEVLQKTIDFIKAQGFSQSTLFGGLVALNERVEETLKYLELPGTKPLIFIDTGHGGSDPGAQYGGYKEKDIVLSISTMLKDLLEKSGDYEIVMSRETDKYLSLVERSSYANAAKADISISIHVNAMGGTWAGLARGIETFIYHPTYMTTRLAFDMDNYRIKESLRLADAVHNSLISYTGLSNRGVRGANLHMVREPNMPAILPELGFINNLGDLAIVTTLDFQQKSAKAIKQGIDIYFAN